MTIVHSQYFHYCTQVVHGNLFNYQRVAVAAFAQKPNLAMQLCILPHIYNVTASVAVERGRWRCYKVIEQVGLIEVIDEGGSIIEIRPRARIHHQLIPSHRFSHFGTVKPYATSYIASHTSYIISCGTCNVQFHI